MTFVATELLQYSTLNTKSHEIFFYKNEKKKWLMLESSCSFIIPTASSLASLVSSSQVSLLYAHKL